MMLILRIKTATKRSFPNALKIKFYFYVVDICEYNILISYKVKLYRNLKNENKCYEWMNEYLVDSFECFPETVSQENATISIPCLVVPIQVFDQRSTPLLEHRIETEIKQFRKHMILEIK